MGYGEKVRAALAILVVVGTVFALRTGYAWAKVLLVLYFTAAVALVAYFHLAVGIPLESHRTGLAAGSQVAQWLLQPIAILLIIRSLKPGNTLLFAHFTERLVAGRHQVLVDHCSAEQVYETRLRFNVYGTCRGDEFRKRSSRVVGSY